MRNFPLHSLMTWMSTVCRPVRWPSASALLLVVVQDLVAGGLQLRVHLVADLRQVLGTALGDGEVTRRLAERSLRLVHARAGDERHAPRQLVLRLALQVPDLVAV